MRRQFAFTPVDCGKRFVVRQQVEIDWRSLKPAKPLLPSDLIAYPHGSSSRGGMKRASTYGSTRVRACFHGGVERQERTGGGAREETSESSEDGCSSQGGATGTTTTAARSGSRIHGSSGTT